MLASFHYIKEVWSIFFVFSEGVKVWSVHSVGDLLKAWW